MDSSSSEGEDDGVPTKVDRREYYKRLGWEEPYDVPVQFRVSQQQLINLYYLVHQIRFLAVGQNKIHRSTDPMNDIILNLIEIEGSLLRTDVGSGFKNISGVKKIVTEDQGATLPACLAEEDEKDAMDEEEEKGTLIIKEEELDGGNVEVTVRLQRERTKKHVVENEEEEEEDGDEEEGSCTLQ